MEQKPIVLIRFESVIESPDSLQVIAMNSSSRLEPSAERLPMYAKVAASLHADAAT